MNSKIRLINVFFGKRPAWFSFFIQSCKLNSHIDFIFISDNVYLENYLVSPNILFVKMTISEFCTLATRKLDTNITILNPYKICDLKPAFGKIFEDYLTNYNFWGYIDIDLILSKLDEIILSDTLQQYDIICGYTDFASGPFCILRNNPLVNNLYSQAFNYKKIFSDPKHYSFDEHIVKESNKKISTRKGLYFLLFLINHILKGNLKTVLVKEECKYRFQWYFKQKTVDIPVDFTEILFKNIKKKKIKVMFKDIISSDASFNRTRLNNWKLLNKNGILYNLMNDSHILIFHFKELKNEKEFIIKDYRPEKDYYICPGGIFYEK